MLGVNCVGIYITDGCLEHYYDQHYHEDKTVPVHQLLIENV